MAGGYKLSRQEKEFAIALMEMGDQVAAYKLAYSSSVMKKGMSDHAIQIEAARMIKRPNVVSFIQDVRGEMSGTALVDVQHLIIDLCQIATVDINEICQIRRECCRYCWGKYHVYEWAPWELEEAVSEWERALDKWAINGSRPADRPAEPLSGGETWHPHREPNPECPRCYGDGVLNTWINDSRKLSPAARKLFDGWKYDKNGNLEIILKSQAEAQNKLLRIFGAWNPTASAKPGDIRNAADKVDETNGITINLIDSPDA